MEKDEASFAALLQSARQQDRNAEQTLLRENLPLVYAIVRRYLHRGAEYDDLVQLGSIGLLKAIRRFDPAYGVCFSTYAVPLIAGEIRRFLRDDAPVKFTRTVKQLSYVLQRTLTSEPDLSLSELAERFHVSEADIAAAFAASNSPLSLDAERDEDGDCLHLHLSDQGHEGLTVDRLLLESLLSQLNERDRYLIRLRYLEDRTQSEVGQELGISQVQVSRLEKRILQSLRENAKEKGAIRG